MRAVGTEKRREKVIVLRELQRVIIYTRELSKQAIEGHVSTAFIGYSVNEGARLTRAFGELSRTQNDKFDEHGSVCSKDHHTLLMVLFLLPRHAN
jgi:hypothetical protein